MFRDKLKKLIKSNDGQSGGNNKKTIENLVFFAVILIVIIVAINLIWNGDKKTNKTQENTTSKQLASTTENNNSSESDFGNDLENILSKMQGVGEVNVFLNYSSSSEVVPMYNENSKTSNTEETDTSGGKRSVQETDTQKDIIYQENSGEKTPITQKVVEAQIEGAIITAKGAGDINVKTNIIQAVEAVTGLATHKIQVFEMK